QEHGLPREESVVAGFSQGGGLALMLALRSSERPHPAGVLAMSPFASAEVVDAIADWDAARSVPVLVQHGTDAPMIPVERARGLAKSLVDHRVPVVYGEYPMGHEVALESVQQARGWLDALRAGEQPSAPLPAPPRDGPVRAVTTAEWEREVL